MAMLIFLSLLKYGAEFYHPTLDIFFPRIIIELYVGMASLCQAPHFYFRPIFFFHLYLFQNQLIIINEEREYYKHERNVKLIINEDKIKL